MQECIDEIDAFNNGMDWTDDGPVPSEYSCHDEDICWTEPGTCGDCCVNNGTPGCEVSACEATVCAVDSFCCAVAWDDICAGEAEDLCGLTTGEEVCFEGGRNSSPKECKDISNANKK